MIAPKLILVGAGPGDPDLFSLKGVKALRSADVLLYDALVAPSLLEYVSESCEVIFVGKQKGVCQFRQEDIHDLIVEKSKENQTIVRLKGGDPYIFGRGHEEKKHAESFGITVEVIPGVSSFYSVPELQGIPLTRRGVNESFIVVTATTKDHTLSEDILRASKLKSTVVVLMGMHKLGEIVDVFKLEQKSKMPVAIIHKGSTSDEKIGLGTIESIQDIVRRDELKSPAIIVIGEVVRLHKNFHYE
jgi:uroporphyrin-III C-methyltransferase